MTWRRSSAKMWPRVCTAFLSPTIILRGTRIGKSILDRLIHLREVEKLKMELLIQVDTLCHKLPNFIEKCAASRCEAGIHRPGEHQPRQPGSARTKRQNKITEYRKMLLAWKQARIITYCGYILGFPNDTPESIKRDVEIVKKELPLDILEFFFLTPLAGIRRPSKAHQAGVVDPDMNKYDLNHATTGHPKMSQQEWDQVYARAWQTYYSADHIEVVLRRAFATRISPGKALFLLVWFKGCIQIEQVHPLEGGMVPGSSVATADPGYQWSRFGFSTLHTLRKL